VIHGLEHHVWLETNDLAIPIHPGPMLLKHAQRALRGKSHADVLHDLQRGRLDRPKLLGAQHLQVKLGLNGFNVWHLVLPPNLLKDLSLIFRVHQTFLHLRLKVKVRSLVATWLEPARILYLWNPCWGFCLAPAVR
jgi:hypothetical protein